MVIGVVKEAEDSRVAVTPELVKQLTDDSISFLVETGSGERAKFQDSEYEKAGAKLAGRDAVLSDSDLLISIHPIDESQWPKLNKEGLYISQFAPFADDQITDKLKKAGIRALSLDMIPRTTLAQTMDVLSSMASVAGYQAVLMAAEHLPRYFPMMITAAGTIRPAKVLVLGAGVAGLQAIATARRLGAMVEAFDTRQAAKEEVESLGAKFVEVEGAVDDTEAGGYAVQQSEEFLKRQREEVKQRSMKADVIITTAQVRGRKAPVLVTKDTVEGMRKGSIIVDLAASTGGNCELTQDKAITDHNGVTIIGDSDLSAKKPQDASSMYSSNLKNLLAILIKDGELALDMDNEIISSSVITA
jgi:NAD(P) transhydrogenase subunit alpha